MVIRARVTLLLRRFAVRAIEFSCAVDGPTIDTCENDGIELASCTRGARISPPPQAPLPRSRRSPVVRGGGFLRRIRNKRRKRKRREKKRKTCGNGGRGFDPGICTEMCNYVIDTHTHAYTRPRSGAARRGDCKLL